MFSDTLPIKSFISNNHQTAFFSMQFRVLRNFSSGIKVIFFPILQDINRPVILFSIRIMINGMSGSNLGSGIRS